VTYTLTQGHKSLGLLKEVIANKASDALSPEEMKMKEKRRRAIEEEDKTVAIQEDQDEDIWSTI
jgi:hypothetical protein